MVDEDGGEAGWMPVKVNVFSCPTRIARALGLDGVELPDVDSRDRAYWERVHAEGWKPKLRGRILDTEEERGDPGWCALLAFPFCAVRFHLAESVVVRTAVVGLWPTLDLVHGLAARGAPLRDAADGEALVKVMQCRFGRVPDVAPAFRAAGLVPEPGRPDPLWWELDPARWPGA
ncbi:hypothetical protein GCM10009416_47630 [Craurococcus roseus]|uniref:Uncharacterized protein n=1 Tax=Craurococcus roseus TaxID=77585 RepID=A0ABN1G5H4_9PROT